jgi:hypothetical protein
MAETLLGHHSRDPLTYTPSQEACEGRAHEPRANEAVAYCARWPVRWFCPERPQGTTPEHVESWHVEHWYVEHWSGWPEVEGLRGWTPDAQMAGLPGSDSEMPLSVEMNSKAGIVCWARNEPLGPALWRELHAPLLNSIGLTRVARLSKEWGSPSESFWAPTRAAVIL